MSRTLEAFDCPSQVFVCLFLCAVWRTGWRFIWVKAVAPPDCSFAGNIYEDKPLSLFLHFTLGQEFTFSIIAGPSDLTSEKSFGPDKNVC